MAIYDGFVSLGEDQIHVILGVGDERVTLSSNGSEIGEWSLEEVAIDHAGDGTYTITAENESLRFRPNDPDLFAIGFGPIEPASSVTAGGARRRDEISPPGEREIIEAPPPRTTTRVAFYALAIVTVSLGLWALVSMSLG